MPSLFQPVNPVTNTIFRLVDAPVGSTTPIRDNECALAHSLGGAAAVQLPALAGLLPGVCCGVYDTDGSAAGNNVAVSVAGGGTIDGQASYVLASSGQFSPFVFDGVQWRRLAGRRTLFVGGQVLALADDAPAASAASVAVATADVAAQVTTIVAGPTGWWGGPFPSSAIWLPRAGAGPWNVNGNLIAQGAAPTVGALLANGIAPASFDGATQGLRTAVTNSDKLIGATTNFLPFTAAAFFRADVLSAPAAFYSATPIVTDDTTHWGLSIDTLGMRGGAWGGGTNETPNIAYVAGTYALGIFRYDGTNLVCRASLPSGTFQQSVARTVGPGVQRAADGVQFLRFGVQGDNSKRMQGDIYEGLTWNRYISDAECAQLVPYFNARFGKGLK
jgi:hypothetical protein